MMTIENTGALVQADPETKHKTIEAKTMQPVTVKILRGTAVEGSVLSVGEVVELDAESARVLVAMGKAVAVAEGDEPKKKAKKSD